MKKKGSPYSLCHEHLLQVLQEVYGLEGPPLLEDLVTYCTTDLVVLVAAPAKGSSSPGLATKGILERLKKLGPYADDDNKDRMNLLQLRNGLATKRISITAMCRWVCAAPLLSFATSFLQVPSAPVDIMCSLPALPRASCRKRHCVTIPAVILAAAGQMLGSRAGPAATSGTTSSSARCQSKHLVLSAPADRQCTVLVCWYGMIGDVMMIGTCMMHTRAH